MGENPFEPPVTAAPRRRSRVRTVLACVIGFIGAVTIICNALSLAYRIFDESVLPWNAVPWSFAVWEIELRVVAMLLGCVWIWSAVLVLGTWWRVGISLAAVNYVLILANPEVSNELRREFAGTQYTTQIPDGRGGAEPVTVQIP